MPVRIKDLTANATLIESTDLLMISQPGRTPSSRKITAQSLLAGPYYAASQCLSKATNLSDLPSASTARANLGLGTAATHPATDFDAAGSAAAEQTRAQAVESALSTTLGVLGTYVEGAASTGGVAAVGVYNIFDLSVENGVWEVSGTVRATIVTGSGAPTTRVFDFQANISLANNDMGSANFSTQHRETDFSDGGSVTQVRSIPVARRLLTVSLGHLYLNVHLIGSPTGTVDFLGTLFARRIS